MAFSGFKKQINKANQYMNEKIGGVEGTKLDDDFMEMERRTDTTAELAEDLQMKTREYLQPNPTARAKMAAVKGISKLSGQAKASTYPQPEGVLGECMSSFGRRLGDDSVYGVALVEAGETFKCMADLKYSLDDNVKQNFLEPLHHLQTKDIKEVMHHRKKLQGRRLDFDCKRRRQTGNDELRAAEDKFAESLHLAQVGMHNLLENDVEQVNQLATFIDSILEFHRNSASMLETLSETLNEKRIEAAEKPRKEFVPKTVHDLKLHLDVDGHGAGGVTPQRSPMASPSHRPNENSWLQGGQQQQQNLNRSACSTPVADPRMQSPARTPTAPTGPCCKAMYDFDPEGEGEMALKEGQVIQLLQKVDDNWFQGTVDGKTGLFPVAYVQVINSLP